MRDQLNGQLYDVWIADFDDHEIKARIANACGFGECRGACDVCHDDDYAHRIIPAGKDAVYDSYEDKLAE